MLSVSLLMTYFKGNYENEVELKKRKMKILKGTILTVFMIFGTIVYAQDFDTFDTDRDGKLNNPEFSERNKSDYEKWDANKDGNLDYVELSDMAYENFDRDRDDFIDEDEWNEGINTGVGESLREEDYNALDFNQDGMLDADEWNNAKNNNTWFDRYDSNKDGLIDNEEWNISTFDDWDINDDNFVDENEFNDYDAFNNW